MVAVRNMVQSPLAEGSAVSHPHYIGSTYHKSGSAIATNSGGPANNHWDFAAPLPATRAFEAQYTYAGREHYGCGCLDLCAKTARENLPHALLDFGDVPSEAWEQPEVRG